MKPRALRERKHDVLKRVGERWIRNVGKVADAGRKLAEGGPAAAASPEQVARYRTREIIRSMTAPTGFGWERVIGATVDLEDNAPTEAARIAGRPVARIVDLLDDRTIGEGFATGFLVAPGLLMTNWHVFAEVNEALGCAAQFGYELNEQGLIDPGVVFELDPAGFFLSDEELDIALVGLKPSPAIGASALERFGQVRLIPTLGKILVGHRVSIIQHPDGRHKHWAVRESKLLREPTESDLFLTYSTDTMPGSSGSPAFNHGWELVAVHHSGVPRMDNGQIMRRDGGAWSPPMPDSEVDWIANEGTRVSRVHAWLSQSSMPDARQQASLEALLAVAVDPITGTNSREAVIPYTVEPSPGSGLSAGLSDKTQHGGTMNITVHGTANFHFGASLPASASPAPMLTTPPPETPRRLERRLRFDSDYDSRPGYDEKFLWGEKVPLPKADAGELLKEGGKVLVLKYHHYSLAMQKDRNLAMWTAANADFSEDKRWRSRGEFGDDTWKLDPRIKGSDQLEDPEFYAPAKKFDRGHIVGRDSVAWGESKEEEEFGNSDSFHWTNCSPQHEDFNRAIFGHKGLWGQLEIHIAKEARFIGKKVTILAGPVLDPEDPERSFGQGITLKVPMKFWKIVVASERVDGSYRLRAYGFMLDQKKAIEEFGWEARFRPEDFTIHQRTLSEITEMSRVKFDESLHADDAMAGVDPEESKRRRPVRALSEIDLR